MRRDGAAGIPAQELCTQHPSMKKNAEKKRDRKSKREREKGREREREMKNKTKQYLRRNTDLKAKALLGVWC